MKNTILRLLVLVLITALHACSFGDGGEGSLTFTARFPDKVVFKSPAGAYKSSAVDLPVEITTIRVTAKHESGTVVLREFDATLRSGELLSIATGVYEVTLEGLVGNTVILRGRKTGVVVETVKVRDAGEFQMGPVDPVAELATAPNLITNQTAITLSGAKEMFTGIKVNEQTFVELNDLAAFEFVYLLTEGENNLTIAAFNAEGVAGTPISLKILLDSKAPKVVSFVSTAGNLLNSTTVALAINVEGASEMMISADPTFRGVNWVPYSATASFSMPANATTVYGQFRDKAGNVSVLASVNVVVDLIPPSAGTVELAGNATAVATLSLSLAISATGATEMVISELPDFAGAQRRPYAESASFELSAGDGLRIVYVRFFDAAGNVMDAQTSFVVDTQAPSNPMIEIVGSPVAVMDPSITVTLSAIEAVDFQVSEDPAFGGASWVAMSASTPFTLSGGDGLKTVYARYRDAVGNASPGVSVSVILDQTPPTLLSVDLANDAVDGWISAVETTNLTPLASFSGSNYDVSGFALVADATVCDNALLYGAMPNTNSGDFGADGLYKICGRLADSVGWAVYGASAPFELDTLAPQVFAGGDVLVNALTSVNAVVTGATLQSWSQVAGPGAIAFGDATTVSTTASADLSGVYTLRISAVDAAGNPASDELQFTWDTDAPTVPTSLVLSANPTSSPVMLTWAGSTDVLSGIADYVVHESPDSGSTWYPLGNTTATSFLLTPSEGNYYYKVFARDGVYNSSAESSWSSALIMDLSAPSVLTFVVQGNPTAVNTTSVALDLSATESGDIQLSEDPVFAGASWVAFTSAPGFTLSGGDGAKTIYLRIRDAVGNISSPVSTNVDLDTSLPSVTFGSPADASVSNSIGSASGTASDSGVGVATVELQIQDTNAGTYYDGSVFTVTPSWVAASYAVGSWSYSLSFLSDSNYQISARAVDAVGNVGNAAPVNFTLDASPPSVPGTPIFSANPASTSVTLSWTASADSLSGLQAYVLEESTDGFAFYSIDFPSGNSFLHTPVNGIYYYRVAAQDLAGNMSGFSPDSTPLQVDTGAPSPGMVNDGLSLDIVFQTSLTGIDANWSSFFDAGTGIDFYEWAIGTAPGDEDIQAFTNVGLVSSASATGLSLTDGFSYFVAVRATDFAGNRVVVVSDGVTVDATGPITGIVEDGFGLDEDVIGSGTFGANWSGFSDAESVIVDYQWGIGIAPGDDSILAFASVGLTTMGSDISPTFTNGITYYVTVIATNGAGGTASASSDGFIYDTLPPTAPGAPTFSANPVSDGVTISWTASSDSESGVMDYDLFVSTDGGSSFGLLTTTGNTFYLYTPGVEQFYYFKVVAKDFGLNMSADSGISSALEYDVTPPTGTSIDIQGAPLAVSDPSVSVGLTTTGAQEYQLSEAADFSGASWTAIVNPVAFILSGGDGAKTIYGRFRDLAGNVSIPVSTGVILDTTPPTGTVVVQGSPAAVSTTSLTLDLTSADAADLELAENASFTVNATGWQAMSSSAPFSLLVGDGAKTIYVRFRDAAGNVSSAFSTGVTLDQTPPTVPGTPGFASNITSGSVNITFTASSDTGVGLAVYEYEVSTDGFTFSPLASNASTTFSYGTVDGVYYYRVRAVDSLGNASGYSATSAALMVDTTPPTGGMVNDGVSIDVNFQTSLTIIDANWSSFFDGESGIDHYEWAIGTSSGGADTQAFMNVGLSGTGSNNVLSLVEGTTYYVTVRAYNQAFEYTELSSDGVLVDATPPQSPSIGIVGSPSAVSTTSITLALAATGATEVQVAEDAGFSVNASGWQAMTASLPFSLTPGDGAKAVYAQYRDQAGNTTSAVSFGVVLDTLAPSVPGTPVYPSVTSGSVTLNWTASSDAGVGVQDYLVEISNNGVTWTFLTFVSPNGPPVSYADSQLDGTYYYRVSARDNIGNVSPPTLDGGAVAIDSTPPTPGLVNDGFGADIDWSTTSISVDSNWSGFVDAESGIASYTWGVGTSPGLDDTVPFGSMGLSTAGALGASLTDGVIYYSTVRAYDNAGNSVETYSNGFTVDTGAPTVTSFYITGNPTEVNSSVVELNMVVSDTVGSVSQMQISEDPAFSGAVWTAYTTPQFYTILGAEGSVTIYSQFKDDAGNISSPGSTNVILDTTMPGSTITNPGDLSYVSSLTAINGTANDTGSGVSTLEISVYDQTTAMFWDPGFGAFNSFTQIWDNALVTVGTFSWTAPALTAGNTYVIETRALDNAGNIESPVQSSTFTFDLNPPTCTTCISLAGVAFTNSTAVDINMDATDDLGTVYSYIDGNITDVFARSWQAFTSFETVTLDGVEGPRTISVQYQDLALNTTAVYSVMVTYDSLLPTTPGQPSFNANPVSGPVTISWAASSDANFLQHELEYSTDAVNYFPLTTTQGSSYSYVDASGGYYYRVRAKDKADNYSTYSPVSSPLTVDTNPPVINYVYDGAGFDPQTQTSLTDINGDWSVIDAESGLSYNEWAIGTSIGGTDVQAFSNVGTGNSGGNIGLTLNVGTSYYVTVRAFDNAGNMSYGYSNGVTVVPDITSTSQASGGVWDQIDLIGTGYGASQGLSTVWMGGVTMPVVSWASTAIQVQVPTGLPAGVYNITVKVNGVDSAPQTFNLIVPIKLAFISAPVTLTAGQCSSTTIDVVTQDGSNFTRGVTQPITINLGSGSLTLYGGPGCTSPLGSTLNIAAGQSGATLFAFSSLAGAENLGVSSPPLTSANQNVTVNPGPATVLFFTSGPAAITTGQCYAYTVSSKDSFNNLSNVGTSVNFTLGGNGAGQFYSDGACSSIASGGTIVSGTDSTVVYFKDLSAESLTLTASDNNVILASGNFGVTVSAVAPNISSLSPATGAVGSTVAINGTDFGLSMGTVYFRGAPTTPTSWNDTLIQFTAPVTTFGAGNVQIQRTDLANSNSVSFDLTPPCCAPYIVSAGPPYATSNTNVIINGYYFGVSQNTSLVYFGTATGPALSWSDRTIIAKITAYSEPGTLAVSVVTGETSNPVFIEHARPWIDERYPEKVTVGTSVNLVGRYFGAAQGLVYIGPLQATVTGWNETNIQFNWPAGAPKGYQAVTIATQAGRQANGVQLAQPGSATWLPMAGDVPDVRAQHTAVWTGAEMIVWGGEGADYHDTGARYNPATDSWLPVARFNAPTQRSFHSAVWTGKEMLVWGGADLSELNTGGRYNPVSDSWALISTAGAPTARIKHTAVWTGRKMIVWGGSVTGTADNTGGVYDPNTDSWTFVQATGAPIGRFDHTAVWTGKFMVVWGGGTGAYLSDGGRYDPENDSWFSVNGVGSPSARMAHTAVWTGTQMIVWGGNGVAVNNDGARYDPLSDTWTSMLTPGGLPARTNATGVWTGSKMIVWGGSDSTGFDTGGVYDPKSDTWTLTSVVANTPSARYYHTAVWTGQEMIVWGGVNSGDTFDSGGRYNPNTDSWVPVSQSGHPAPRQGAAAVWTGSELFVWGGFDGATYRDDGGRYNPATDTWLPTKADGSQPTARQNHTAVWSGNNVIVWGGDNGGTSFSGGLGAKYDPAGDTWTTMGSATRGRKGHTATWLFNGKMLVAGGIDQTNAYSNLTELYDEGLNTFTSSGTLQSVHVFASAAYAPGKVLIFGGMTSAGVYTNAGDVYNIGVGAFTAMNSTGAPSARAYHVSVTDGNNKLIVWGGYTGSPLPTYLSTSSVYNISLNSWTTMNATGQPAARENATAVWTGSRMLVWGGDSGLTRYSDGGLYDPVGNSWSPILGGPQYVPQARSNHQAVWTGNEMMIWGGSMDTAFGSSYGTGGIYVP